MRSLVWFVLGALVALVAVLLAMNLTGGGDDVKRTISPPFDTGSPQFPRTMGQILGPPLVGGNGVDAFVNGDEIFPAMLTAIRGAQESITFETFIYWEGRIGRTLAGELARKAREGVAVHVLIDWYGSQKMDETSLDLMRDAGVEIQIYRPIRWYTLDRINNRTHRKILVVDGRVGFTGGVGIADSWLGDARSPEEWRDTHFRIQGPVVAQLQAAFLDNWERSRGVLLLGDAYFPELQPEGSTQAQVSTSSPEDGSERARLLYLVSIAAARRTIDLSTAYFIPDEASIQSLVEARGRGVRVRIIVPGPHVDLEVTRRASRALWGPLLRAGVEIHEYQPTMFHVKTMVVDGLWSSVGSTNFDERSFKLNDEANLNVLDPAFAAARIQEFERDLAHSKQVTWESWSRRPWKEKARERLSALLRWQL
ncbi:MAG TPA: phospholipase D-like domain-containing protein [Thermoanaerobaculia bacterium]|nr:phospholipase D-like domain-containing protein [Thermoanaerobaculia bacterium]